MASHHLCTAETLSKPFFCFVYLFWDILGRQWHIRQECRNRCRSAWVPKAQLWWQGQRFSIRIWSRLTKKKRRSFLWRDRQPATHPPKKADKRICQRETLPLCVNPKVCNSASVRYSCTIRYQVRYRISNTTIAHILFNELPFTLLIITKQRQNVLPPSDHIWTWLTSGRETTQLLFTSRLFTSPPDPTTYRIKTRVDYSYYLNICSIYFQFI